MKVIKKIKPFFIDDRGEMSLLIDEKTKITSVLFITCKKGSIRANHYHKKDSHYSYLVSGKMEYTYKSLSKLSKEKKLIINPGDMVYSPPKTIHAMRFLKESIFIAFATKPRKRKGYEDDTVRVNLIK